MDAETLKALKDYLRVSWDDDDGNISGMAYRGIAYIDSLAGQAQNYSVEGEARSLLFDYVRYAFSHASAAFTKDFAQEILHLQLTVAADQEAHDD